MKTPRTNAPLPQAELDAALAADHEAILPSSGFTGSVMSALLQEAAAPAPIPFPWKRAVPGLIAALGILALMVIVVVRAIASAAHAASTPAAASSAWPVDMASILHGSTSADALWILFALSIPAACLLLCRRLLLAR